MQKQNYQKMLEGIIGSIPEREAPTLLLHSCCAPCSSYCLEYLAQYFRITLLYYNPNISPKEEFDKRTAELRRLVAELPMKFPAQVVVPEYRPEEFYSAVKGLENIPEGGKRCFACYRLRLERSAQYAAEHGFDYFCSTLSISPMKNAEKLNSIGAELSGIYSVKLLPSDFKKKGGYLRSIELSKEYGLYRQNYCGCVFSKREAEQRESKKESERESQNCT